ncbi:Regulatory protein Spx [Synechococcus sp. MIT S9509]|uniref:arsenate reductase family protein n=1 Tax=unclassified Synechococcus TaxID=2626047 RepID=UPI0007BBAE52|nr:MULTISPECIES: arsenate reductase family protein [unclassified Synechococcus]KZR86887.1 Regulatory protein Spx [Synechococcus sp. MIT S9504]KZR92957.1 Regulatory protein Spx [Synechococcus sp. MIT S9509]
MADFTVFSYPRCSTCRKALAWLESEGLDHEVIDITLDPPSLELLQLAFRQFGQVKPMFNTSGQSYRAIGAEAVKLMSDEQALQALAADGKLIKRPFVQCPDGRFLVGFKPETWSESLLS